MPAQIQKCTCEACVAVNPQGLDGHINADAGVEVVRVVNDYTSVPFIVQIPLTFAQKERNDEIAKALGFSQQREDSLAASLAARGLATAAFKVARPLPTPPTPPTGNSGGRT